MLTKETGQAYEGLPEAVKSAILALSILIDRIGTIPKADRDDLFELLQAWRSADNPEEQRAIRRAMEEVLAQIPISATPLAESPKRSNKSKWAEFVGKKIRELREQRKLTQSQLAVRAGLPQSHISRLENAEYTATSMTLEKIANALGIAVAELEPCAG